jgi:hypothetical protein
MTEPRRIIVRGDRQRRRVCEALGVRHRTDEAGYPEYDDITGSPIYTAANLDDGWEVVIRKHKGKRNLQQNAAMWAMLTEAGKRLGYSPEEMHELAKAAYFGTREIKVPTSGRAVLDETITIINGGTSKLNVEEMSAYLDWLVPWLTEHAEIDARSIRRAYRE